MNVENLEDDELISLYPKLLKELKRREIRGGVRKVMVKQKNASAGKPHTNNLF